ncbi:SDR family NAD(P)-dependent oxidoreductase [Pseudolabrys taiwanensis]|uniref:SDR family NAD(P)-dependent oxidoreductase n=1 Tax=Pseudolabrys taiwanensis TaxID=331696 RepID=A0A345ZTV4_9HYPH|nr:SDR family oxidoreductase [Pseudolabrys taiwanensis]AXK80351.1 SDR family NAD(P)-dependent oxidoreductase [Pseudolabrys taiwanensis]
MTQRFSGKRIVITGAGRGLGFAFAERLAREGASVIIAEIDEALGHEAEKALKAQGLDARFVQTDISSEASVAALAKASVEGVDGIHGVVANAGWANNVGGKLYDEITPDVWDRMMAINVRGTWLTIRALGPLVKNGGAIVTLSSDTIYWGAPKLLHYVTSKSAIVGMTRSLAREFGERMIRVNCLLPGLTKVEATKDIPETRWNDYAERTILKRTQQPDDLDGVVAFLLSDDSKFITGQTLAVDGGFSMH